MKMDKFVKEKVRVTCGNLKKLAVRKISEIDYLMYKPCGYKKPQELPQIDGSWSKLNRFDRVSGHDQHFWVYTQIETPSIAENEQLMLTLKTSLENEWADIDPQCLVYLNGTIAQGLDVYHRNIYLKPNTKYDILIYFYTGLEAPHMDILADLMIVDEKINKLYYDISVPYDAAMCYKEDEYTHIKTMNYLERACNMLDLRQGRCELLYESIDEAEKFLSEEFYGKVCGNSEAIVNYIGHTHIDVAWLWTLDQTKEKVQRSFSTVLSLMDRYPEYIFMSSQPQLYEFLKEEEPELYERVKEKVKEGRWEVEGAMWLEAECNLSSGESLIRQIIYGKKFMKDEFGVESNVLWLPDVFGYSAAVPQILKKPVSTNL